MKNLIVYAHPNHKSFNHAIVNTIVQKLQSKNEEVEVRDLYKLSFNPVLTLEEMTDLQENRIADDVKTEQELISQSDTLIFIYPIWWTSMPAIIKGYFDRVFSYGFAYSANEQGEIEGLLQGKKAIIINTHGTPNEHYDASGMTEALSKTTDTGIFEFSGIKVKKHLFLGAIPFIDTAAGEEILAQIASSL